MGLDLERKTKEETIMRKNLIVAAVALALISVAALVVIADDTGKEAMEMCKRMQIERVCERQVYTFLKLFEREHAKTADLFTEDGSVPFPAGKITVGREAIREFFSTIDAKDVELNLLLANNLLITVVDEDNATGLFCYVTHLQHLFEDSKREGMGVLGEPNTVTSWFWEFKRVKGEWKIGKLDVDLTLLNERFHEYFSD
jgi:hypothetical protein